MRVMAHLLNRPASGAIHSSALHAVRFGSLQPGSILPARALFFLGMDEENFPRKEIPSSLDLLRNEKGFIPRPGDIDRYLMLQALFAAKEHLYFSYGHLSAEEGKPVAPSLVLQELMTDLDSHFENGSWLHPAPPLMSYPEQKPPIDFFGLERPFPELPVGEIDLQMSDLAKLARHPWNFYLQKTLGIYIERNEIDSFSGQKTILAKETLLKSFDEKKLLPGILGEAQKLEIEELSNTWKKELQQWGLALAPWSMLATCREKKIGSIVEVPPLKIQIHEYLTVNLIGDLPTMSDEGFVSTTDEIHKIWPEALVGALLTGKHQFFLLKKGKTVSIADPLKEIRSFLIYYFRALSHPAPLVEKSRYEDPVEDWVLSRFLLPDEKKWAEKWETLNDATV